MKKLITFLILMCCVFVANLTAQIISYPVNRNITCTDTLRFFNANDVSYGISISGSCRLHSDSGYVRVVLADYQDREWLVYERNDLYATEANDTFRDAAFETSLLDSILPKYIFVIANDAALNLSNIKSLQSVSNRKMIDSISNSAFLKQNLKIIKRINARLASHKKAWRADTTSFSNLKYREKKALFGVELPNLRGCDYYAYGYYSPLDDNTPPASDNIVKEFDWRTRHGSSNSDSYCNVLGRTVMQIELEADSIQKVVDLRNLANGIYSYTIKCGELIQTKKIVINK